MMHLRFHMFRGTYATKYCFDMHQERYSLDVNPALHNTYVQPSMIQFCARRRECLWPTDLQVDEWKMCVEVPKSNTCSFAAASDSRCLLAINPSYFVDLELLSAFSVLTQCSWNVQVRSSGCMDNDQWVFKALPDLLNADIIHPAWQKMLPIYCNLKKHKLVFWMDSDTYVSDIKQPFELILDATNFLKGVRSQDSLLLLLMPSADLLMIWHWVIQILHPGSS